MDGIIGLLLLAVIAIEAYKIMKSDDDNQESDRRQADVVGIAQAPRKTVESAQ